MDYLVQVTAEHFEEPQSRGTTKPQSLDRERYITNSNSTRVVDRGVLALLIDHQHDCIVWQTGIYHGGRIKPASSVIEKD